MGPLSKLTILQKCLSHFLKIDSLLQIRLEIRLKYRLSVTVRCRCQLRGNVNRLHLASNSPAGCDILMLFRLL
eukprot:UN03331